MQDLPPEVFFRVAGITIGISSELEIEKSTFSSKLGLFAVDEAGDDLVRIAYRFGAVELDDPGVVVYRSAPWVIYRSTVGWVYVSDGTGTSEGIEDSNIHQVSLFSRNYREAVIWNGPNMRDTFMQGGLSSLTMTPSDQIILAQLLADRQGCYLHADGIKMKDGRGFLFVGHSGAGKSTIATLLQQRATILCDDRMIVRKWEDGYRIHGNWSHGSLPIVSPESAGLTAIFFLEQADENSIVEAQSMRERLQMLLGCVIRPLVTADWWEKTLALVEDIALSVPCYRLRFDRSGKIYRLLEEIR